jgi:hypothetical protein
MPPYCTHLVVAANDDDEAAPRTLKVRRGVVRWGSVAHEASAAHHEHNRIRFFSRSQEAAWQW